VLNGSGRYGNRDSPQATGNFGFCETPEVLVALTRWVRLRLRAALWRQWKTPRRKFMISITTRMMVSPGLADL
jgi:hypothetical protein